MTNTDQRRTRQRVAIKEYLSTVDEFRNAQQIHQGLVQAGTPVSLPTVYRTLSTMAESGDIDHIMSEGQTSYRQCSTSHHHHLLCRSCGHTIELTHDPVEQWIAEVGRTYGFTHITHLTEITGLCSQCRVDT
jgi:Fur family ferric uptake transcriptional regulator